MKKLIVLFSFFLAVSARAQVNNINVEKPYIEVTGTAETEVVPDEIYISIVIRERYAGKEKQTIEMQEEKLKFALVEIGVDMKNLYLADANADYVKIKWRTKDVLTKKDYLLKVNNAGKVGQVFQQLDKLEITDAYIAKVNHSKIDSLKKEIRIQAIKAAKTKADYLLKAINEQTDKALIVQERENFYGEPRTSNVMYKSQAFAEELSADEGKAKSENEIEFKKIKIQASMFVKFSIKQ